MHRTHVFCEHHVQLLSQNAAYCVCTYPVYRSKSVMDTEMPDVLNQLVANYELFLKSQKETSDEISKFTDSSLKKIKQETAVQQQVNPLSCIQCS